MSGLLLEESSSLSVARFLFPRGSNWDNALQYCTALRDHLASAPLLAPSNRDFP